jgi:hypothetical protein
VKVLIKESESGTLASISMAERRTINGRVKILDRKKKMKDKNAKSIVLNIILIMKVVFSVVKGKESKNWQALTVRQ